MPKNIFKIYDGRTSFWQWDLGQKIIVSDELPCDEVHFDNGTMANALRGEVYELDGKRLVNVPDEFFQSCNSLRVFAYVSDDKGHRTTYSETFKVQQKPRPDNYVYTEYDVRTWDGLDDRIRALEQSGVVDPESVKDAVEDYLSENPIAETDPTVPAWAKQPSKPTYTPEEIGAQPAGDYVLRSEIPENPEIPEIPEALPNPHKLTFTGAVNAEYDGSKEVEVNIPEGGSGIPIDTAEVGQTIVVKAVDENGKPTEWEAADLPSGGVYPVISMTSSTAKLMPNTFYRWGEMTELTVTLGNEADGVTNEYCFEFTSGSVATILTLPQDIKWAVEPTVDAGKTYQVSIMNGIGVMVGA